MNPVEIEEAVSQLAVEPFDREEFPFQFLAAFGNKKTTLDRLRKGATNQSDVEDGVLQRSNIHIATCAAGDVAETLTALRDSPKTASQKAKLILATDGHEFQAEDVQSGEVVACDYPDFANHFGFFLPLSGITTTPELAENPFDIKATGRLNKLYVQLRRDNPEWEDRREDMNHFMARLIFCFFAEDTDIFHAGHKFTETVERMTSGAHDITHEVIGELFRSMNTKHAERDALGIKTWARAFPYVNGELFSGSLDVPRFSKIARSYLLQIGNLDWTKINPDIFGSMIQAVADDEERGALGMHYTSVPNILKVLNPLFLDDLRAKLEEAGDNGRKLLNLRNRMAKIRVFDPACGSGNFLVIAYKQMREIEAEINRRRGEPDRKTNIPKTNFRGIEIRDFPAEIARLALIIAEYQCDVLYRGQKEALAEFLPLNSENWIKSGNSLRMDWIGLVGGPGLSVRTRTDDLLETPLEQPEIDFEQERGEIYLCANPPFAGQKKKVKSQRDDMSHVMPRYFKSYGELDYVCAFYVKAAEFAKRLNATAALVSTNSVIQGRHAPLLWPALEKMGLEIVFGYRSFLWRNNASHNASVYCVIVGISPCWTAEKFIVDGPDRIIASHINGYLIDAPSISVQKRKKPLAPDLQTMRSGNMPLDNGNLLLTGDEARALTLEAPSSSRFLRKVVGAKEINQGLTRYCLWISDGELDDARKTPEIQRRISACAEFRRTSSAPDLADRPHQFRDTHCQKSSAIIIPNLSSEKRQYRVPIIVGKDVIPTNLALAIYDGDLFQYAILASRIHHLWVEAVCGKLKMDFRYSNDLGWHTFPLPKLTAQQKIDLDRSASAILCEQERAFPKTLNELYNGEDGSITEPALEEAHRENDLIVERIFVGRKFKNDTERLEHLFKAYQKVQS